MLHDAWSDVCKAHHKVTQKSIISPHLELEEAMNSTCKLADDCFIDMKVIML